MIENIIQTPDGYEATIDGVLWYIPNDPANRYWGMVQNAIESGTPVTVKEPPVVQPDPKMVGVEFNGVMCSATEKDQNGLAAVLMAIQLQGAAFQPTKFYFENGNTLVISLANYQQFAAVWLPFRQSFFIPDEEL